MNKTGVCAIKKENSAVLFFNFPPVLRCKLSVLVDLISAARHTAAISLDR